MMNEDHLLYIALGIIALIFLFQGKKYFMKFYGFLENKKRDKTIKIISEAYAEVEPFVLSLNYRKEHNINKEELTYGEILPFTLLKLLDIAKPSPGDTFYDLGCGVGKAVILAAACYPLAASKGYEILPPLYQAAQNTLTALKARGLPFLTSSLSKVQFESISYLESQLKDADIIFINATSISMELWTQVLYKLQETKVGSRVILTTHKLFSEEYELLYQGQDLMSWGLNSTYIYKKIRPVTSLH